MRAGKVRVRIVEGHLIISVEIKKFLFREGRK
jgi:hypothetical protein